MEDACLIMYAPWKNKAARRKKSPGGVIYSSAPDLPDASNHLGRGSYIHNVCVRQSTFCMVDIGQV